MTKPDPVYAEIGKTCNRIFAASKKARKTTYDTGRRILQYAYASNHDFQYASPMIGLGNSWFKAKQPKTAEALAIIVPRLLPGEVVSRLLTPDDGSSPEFMARTAARQAYLNYAADRGKYLRQRRRATQDAVVYGYGTLWTGRDPRSGLITSQWDSAANTFLDPNAKAKEDQRVVFRRRTTTKADLLAEIKQFVQQDQEGFDRAFEMISAMDCTARRASDDEGTSAGDCVEWIEAYFDRGIHQFEGGVGVLQAQAQAAGKPLGDKEAKLLSYLGTDQPMRYLFTPKGELIYQTEWPIPFHQLPDDPWPVTVMEFLENPDSIYPVSLLQPGLCFQEAINHLTTLMMSRARAEMKLLIAAKKSGRKGMTKADLQKAFRGGDVEMIEIESQGPDKLKLSDVIEKLDWSYGWIPACVQLLQVFEESFERATGLYSSLYTGAPSVQDRSAEATRSRERNAQSRIEDARDAGRNFDTQVAKKEAFAAGYLLSGQDVGKMLPTAGQAWGFLGTAEGKQPQKWVQVAMQNGISDPNAIAQFATEQAANAYTMDELIWQTSYEIEAGSTRRKDVDLQLGLIKEQKNTVMPVQLQSPDPNEKALAYDLLAAEAKLSGMPNQIADGYAAMAQQLRQIAAVMQQAASGQPPPQSAAEERQEQPAR